MPMSNHASLAGKLMQDYGRFSSLGALPDNPLVGVVIPAKNEAAYITKAIESVQGSGNLKIYPVVNGSTDNTAGIAKQRNGAVYSSRPGVGNARNAGYAQAVSDGCDIIVFMDADVAVLPGAIKRVVDQAKKGEEWGFGSVRGATRDGGIYYKPGAVANSILTPVQNAVAAARKAGEYLPPVGRLADKLDRYVPKLAGGSFMYITTRLGNELVAADGTLFNPAQDSREDLDIAERLHRRGERKAYLGEVAASQTARRVRKDGQVSVKLMGHRILDFYAGSGAAIARALSRHAQGMPEPAYYQHATKEAA